MSSLHVHSRDVGDSLLYRKLYVSVRRALHTAVDASGLGTWTTLQASSDS